VNSIPYVRFDGQMSAKRRQEAIARFSVPLEAEVEETPALSRISTKTRSGRSSVTMEDVGEGSDNDGDLLNRAGDDDDFIDYSDDDGPFSGKRSKGKGKARARPAKAYEAFDSSDSNPKVMLLSLKAVCALNWIMLIYKSLLRVLLG